MQFEFAAAGQIFFGPGSLQKVFRPAASLGRRALLVHGCSSDRAQTLVNGLVENGVGVEAFCVTGEPTVETARQAVSLGRQAGCDLVIAFGGGSAIDTAKAAAALLSNPGDPLDYLEVIGKGRAIEAAPLPCIAIPTTAGTGSEVTRNAVLGSPEHGVKVSLRSPLMLPVLAVVDPQLTHSLPPEITASTGLDALTQLIEPFVSIRANPLTDGLCREGIPRAARSLAKAVAQGDDNDARTDMALASLFGGLALANAGLGAVHGFAGVLGGAFPGPHGAICARLLPLVMKANLAALRQRQPQNPALLRYTEVARLLTGDRQANAAAGLEWVQDLIRLLGVPALSSYGISAPDLPGLVERSQRASSMKANPLQLSLAELHEILSQAL